MGADGIVGNAHCGPHCLLAATAAAQHLENPGLVGVAHGERLALAVVAIGVDKGGHHLDGLAGGLAALQGDVHETAVVENARRIDTLLAAAKGGLAYRHLPLVDVAYHVVGFLGLGNLAPVGAHVAVIDLAHLALGVAPGLEVIERVKGAERVAVVGAHHAAVGAGALGHDDACAGQCLHHGRHGSHGEKEFFHT